MVDHNAYFIISKIIPVYSFSQINEEYIMSVDFVYPEWLLLEYFHRDTSIPSDSYSVRPEIDVCDSLYSVERASNVATALGDNICRCIQTAIYANYSRKVKIKIDELAFSFIMFELRRSKTFRMRILSKLFIQFSKRQRETISNQKFRCQLCNKIMWLVCVIVFITAAKKNIIDYKWNKNIEILVNEKCELENAMAWLSTLGGAFSALGDSYLHCAEKAGAISMQQLYIALRLGDPLTICRCKIYLTMSLLQRGYYRKTKKML
ncbi:hypothetical protein X975_22171, partial [Stegodyphus mimosarum]